MKTNAPKKKESLAGNIIFFGSLLILAAAIVYTFFNANDPTGTFIFGYKPQMIKSDSMAPELYVNSLIMTKQVPFTDIKENDIITFKTDDGLYFCHRVRGITSAGFVTKGDNNRSVDSKIVREENYLGKVVGQTNLIPEFLETFKRPTFARVFTFIVFPLAVAGVIVFASILLKKKKEPEEDPVTEE